MRFPEACYQMLETLDTHVSSCLLPAQRRCLACSRLWHHHRPVRLPESGDRRRAPSLWQQLQHAAPVSAGLARRWRGHRGVLPDPGRHPPLLRPAAALGPLPLAGWAAHAGGRCDQSGGSAARTLHQCGLPGLCDPRRLARHAGWGEGCLHAGVGSLAPHPGASRPTRAASAGRHGCGVAQPGPVGGSQGAGLASHPAP